MKLRIERVSPTRARDFLARDDDLWEKATLGAQIGRDFEFRPGSWFIGGFLDEQVSLLHIHHPGPDNRIHFYVKASHRREHARECLERSISGLPWPLYAEIPISRRATINFAIHHRFLPVAGGRPGRQLLRRD